MGTASQREIPKRRSRHLSVAVVGGSLGGLCVALALRRIGCDVEVFERSTEQMSDRGAGIVMQFELGRLLEECRVGHRHSVSVASTRRRHLARNGSTVWEEPAYLLLASWDALYRALRKAFPDENYHLDSKLVGFEQTSDRVLVRFENGREVAYDLLVCADGAGSTGRSLLFPEVSARYAGYVGWRGLVEEGQVQPEVAYQLTDQFTLFQAPRTHMLCYLIPGQGGELSAGKRRFNWVWYWNVPDREELQQLLTDRDGFLRDYLVPQGALRPDVIERQAAIAREELPDVFCRLFEGTKHPFLQPIYDLAAPRMASGRVCLIGDAAFVPRPHSAASTAKAAANALALAKYLTLCDYDVAAALRRWEPEQLATGRFLNHVGACLGHRSQFGERSDAADNTYLQLVPIDALRLGSWIAADEEVTASWRASWVEPKNT